MTRLGTTLLHTIKSRTEPVFALRGQGGPRSSFRQFSRGPLGHSRRATSKAPHLDEYSWHGNRHTFASRLAMAGVDLLTIKEVGGWRTLAMVQRYAHFAPGHLQAAVERLVSPQQGAVELARN